MIMMGDRKRQAAAILGDEPKEKEKEPEGEALKTIIEEFIDCIHARDIDGALAAFKSAVAECGASQNVESDIED